MPDQPRISAAFISDTDVKVSILNYEAGKQVNLYMATGYLGVPEELIRDLEAAEYIIEGLNPEGIYKIVASFNDAPIEQSILIVSKDAGPPPIITFSPVGDTTVTETQQVFAVSWGADLALDILQIEGLIEEWYHGNETIATGQNQTL